MDDALGVFGDVALVGDHQDRPAGVVQLLEQSHDLFAGLRVEVAGRLVGEQEGRLVGQRSGDRDPLALSPRKLARIVIEPIAESDPFEEGAGALATWFVDHLMEHHRQRDVLGGR